MKKIYATLLLLIAFSFANGQSYLVGPTSPAIGANINYTAHNHYDLFDVLNATGVYIDSITIHPATASTSYTIVVQNSSSTLVASYTGTSTVGSNSPERIKVNLFVPYGTDYRLGLTSGSVGMLRNSDGTAFPYTVPNVISLTGSTFTSGSVYWYFFYNIRVHLPITATDAGISHIVSPIGTVCSGSQPVSVMLKNYGPAVLTGTDIEWSVNNVAQDTFHWTGSIAIMDSAAATVGQYNFLTGTTYGIKANTSTPNNVADTINNNDTASVAAITVKTAPTASSAITSLDICHGDTAHFALTLTGSPPWDLSFQSGTTVIPFNNIMNGNFNVSFAPAATTSYTLDLLSDVSGCEVDPAITLSVNVFPAPPAVITPQGGATAACQGDSVVLMGSIGLNFNYQWYKDGMLLPGPHSYVFAVKETGSYTVAVTSPVGCSATSAPVSIFIHPAPLVNLGNDTAVLPGQAVLLDAGSGFNAYNWSTGGNNQTLLVDSTGTGIGIKTVWVMVTDNNGCDGGDTIHINFSNNPGISEPKNSSLVSIFPNPANDKIEVLISDYTKGVIQLKIFTIEGNLVSQGEYALIDGRIYINTSALPTGQYLMNLNAKNLNEATRFIIAR